ncbi:MAG: YdeI/OmpD-associated family protein [Crocinitomicaceae bacterium]|nr:YdeI/OmpD-associated family protein [Crocinitomicaceae bacterium]
MRTFFVTLPNNARIEIQNTLSRTSIYGFDIPEEYTAVLGQDDHTNMLFEGMTTAEQRTVIYIVLQLKSRDKRIEKTLFLVHPPTERCTIKLLD